MNHFRVILVGFVVLTWSFAARVEAEELQPGLAIGTTLLPFNVKDCTGPAAGKTLCYFCRYGKRPVAAIFTRELNDDVVNLIKKTDDAVERHRDARLAAFVVYLQKDTAKAEQQLKQLAKTKRLLHTPLTILKESSENLRIKYGIAPNAAVTVMSWRDLQVRSSQAFESPDFSSQEFARLLRSVEAVAD